MPHPDLISSSRMHLYILALVFIVCPLERLGRQKKNVFDNPHGNLAFVSLHLRIKAESEVCLHFYYNEKQMKLTYLLTEYIYLGTL